MAIRNLDYWYDRVQYRLLQQLVRAFSGFQYQTGYNGSGGPQLMMVPCTYANTNRQVANIISNNSENTLQACPRITIWQSDLKFRREDVQNPWHVDTKNVVERKYNANTNSYTTTQGNSYTVQKIMPRPYQMDIQVDIWTSNQDQMYQLLEQILPVISPSFDIQSSQNPLDWTALNIVYLEDVILSSRSVPIGTDNDLNISTIKLKIPMWLSAPAKVKAQNIITTIVSNIFDDGDDLQTEGYGGFAGTQYQRVATTPGDRFINVSNGVITLLGAKNGTPTTGPDSDYSWSDYLVPFGLFRPAQSAIWLYYTDDFDNGPFVSGTLQMNPNAPNQLFWQVDPDTIPANTLPPITALINPLKNFPGNGLPAPSIGTSYLIANDIGPSSAWGNITAYTNDIISYTNAGWVVSFSSRTNKATQLVLNLYTNNQLKWTGSDWIMSIDAIYAPGYWRLKL